MQPITKKQIRLAVELLLNSTEKLTPNANLIELGLDSMTIMRLVDQWRRQGVKVTFADLIETPTLQHWYSLLQTPEKVKDQTTPNTELLTRTSVQNYQNEKPFPLTDVQYAYWIGRQDEQQLGGVGCHAYIELNGVDVNPRSANKSLATAISTTQYVTSKVYRKWSTINQL